MNTPINEPTYYLAHIQNYLNHARSPLYTAQETASLAYNLPIWELPQTATLIAPKRSSKLIPIPGTPIRIRKITRNYPTHAYQTYNHTPTLTPEYYILEQLHHPNPINALIGADAMLRKLIDAKAHQQTRQTTELQEWKNLLQNLATETNLGHYTKRVQRRIPHINPYAENPFETALRVRILQTGIKQIEAQYQIQNPQGGWVFTDLYLPQLNIICAVDWRGYLPPEDYTGSCSDPILHRLLTETGWNIVLINPMEIAAPNATSIVAERLRLNDWKLKRI